MRHFVKYDLVPVLSMLAVCGFPCVFMFARNAAEVPPSAMLPFLVVFTVNALAFFFLTLIFFRNASRAAFWTDAAMLVVINFCLLAVHLKRVVPFLRDRYLLAVLLVLLIALFVLLLRKKPDLRTGCLLVLIAFGAMTVMNGVMAIPAMVGSHEVRREFAEGREPDEFDLSGVRFTKDDRPNVYCFLFDEYGGYENLLHYYDYDNGPFLRELENQGFSVAYESRNPEAIHTDALVSNLLNLDYVVTEEDSGHKQAMFRNNCQLYRMFAANGYQINLINHVDYLGTSGCRVLTSHQTRRTISEYLMRNSLYNKSRWLRYFLDQFFVSDYGANYRASLDNALEVSLHCWEETQGKPTLTVGYIQCPHSPTMVGPHGEALPFENGWNWRDHSLYLGQVEFINGFIRDLVEQLRIHDPEALILLLSDHGNRYALHMVQLGEIESYDPHVENPYMQNVLSCVYYPGTAFEIEGQTGINTMRTVFSQVFGADLPPIEPLEDYAYNFTDEAS